MNTEVGLREKIRVATSDEEIDTLLKEGESFKYASARSERAWRLTAERRRAELKRDAEGTQGSKIETRQHNGDRKEIPTSAGDTKGS